jgi:hypothetical protein
VTIARQLLRSRGAPTRATAARVSWRRFGVGTPWKGIVDFMYACIAVALLGSAAAARSLRTTSTSSGTSA